MNKHQKSSLPAEIGKDLSDATRRDLGEMWDLLATVPEPQVSDDDVAWEEMRQRIRSGAPARRRPSRPPVAHRRTIVRIAAAFACFVLAATIWITTRTVTLTADLGDVLVHSLPDGSSVTLNSGASVAYRPGFGPIRFGQHERVVRMTGEALFDVQPARGMFAVETFNARVEVRGTRFNVRAWGGSFDEYTSVTLFSGAVRVMAANGAEATLNEPGATSKVRFGAPDLDVISVPLEHAGAWTERAFVMADEPIGAIVAEMERRYAVRIDISGDVDLRARMSLFYPRGAEVESILRDICLARGLTYRMTTRGYSIDRL